MGFITDIFSGSKGAGYQAQGAPFAQGDLNQQNAFLNALFSHNNQQGLNQVQDMLMQQAQGKGPNPAQAMLNQATAQNAAQQAALMGSQRGVSANPGLLARQASNQGAQIQQQAAGQAATLQANQQLAAQQALQNQLLHQQGLQAETLGGINQNRVSMQGNINNANAGIAAQNAKTQGGIFGGLLNGLSGIPSLLSGGGGGSAAFDPFSEAEAFALLAKGGEVNGPASHTGKYFKNLQQGGEVQGHASVKGDSYKNDKVPALLSPKEIVLPRSVTMADDAPARAARFVEAVLSDGKLRKK